MKKTAVLALLVTALTATAAFGAVNFANAPRGTHFVTGFAAPVCAVNETTNTVSCTGTQLAGVGNTNATVSLEVTGTASFLCHNPGNDNIVEPHTQTVSDETTTVVTSTKNGRLTIPAQTVTISLEEAAAGFSCPNPNWRAELTDVDITSFTYSVTFAGFTDPAILITG